MAQSVLRALLVLGLAALPHATKKGQTGSLKLESRIGLKGKSLKLVLDPSVLMHFASKSDSTIANMSLSPWTYRDSSVASRVPRRITQAQCLTSGCLSLQGGGEDSALQAKPIYYEVLVLHRVLRRNRKGKKTYNFRLDSEVIAVGCTCVRPSIIVQQ
ncbi:interleukin 17a/f3 isoform X1 [Embiotoca jacksoni]|uniref:interleukin 17a/f3 isoform X1 n=1 Tax=Embiotoca jacksoni TaxID=100190 RepID=UPI003703FABA